MTTTDTPLPTAVPAAVYKRRGQVDVEQRELPPPGTGQVVVEVSYCGVCGSDLHLVDEGWGRPGDVLGHEWTGVVVAVGDDVADLRAGDAVLGSPSPRCGVCQACRDGKPSQCEDQEKMTGEFDGAFATHVVRDAGSVAPVPDGMDLRTAALAEPLAVALHAITRSEIRPGQDAMVFGAGPIGALIAATLVVRGHRVVVVEPAPTRQDLARRLGAAQVLHPSDLRTFNMAEVDSLVDDPVHVAFDSSGKKAAMEAGFYQLRRGGRLVLVGTGMEPPSFDPNRTIVLELSVVGAFVYDLDGFDRALELLADGELPVDALIDDVEFGLDGVAEATARLARGELAGKVMIRPNGTSDER
jgi:(R,R)-butanediol dehydrogenase / meso-butanediol dehydrogenase / diacetyl reductase